MKHSIFGEVLPEEKWGPYVGERGWGLVREDYSADGNAWDYFPHDHARFRTYRRAEDGIAGISDRFQVLLFALAFWNEQDPILKERLFGLNSEEGNHGEDVKELYYYLDATPDHSYLRYLYKYPQRAFPYRELVEENRKRGLQDREYELIDTGVFDDDRYFDISIEYAKVDAEDLCVRIEATNRGKEGAPLHILPHLWFRNQWSWSLPKGAEPSLTTATTKKGVVGIVADDHRLASPKALLFDYHLGRRFLYGSFGGNAIFTDNETNREALWQQPNETPYVKDAFHRYVLHKEMGAINPDRFGTKSALHYVFPNIEGGKSVVVELRFSPKELADPLKDVAPTIAKRKKEADTLYEKIHPKKASLEEKQIQRQALSSLIWSKQAYIFDVGEWLQGDPISPPPPSHKTIRNMHWRHITSMRIFAMPDKWEYPWFAAWDLTFHALSHALLDIEFAKNQLWLLLFDSFQHPSGALPAYEWEFSDVNPPIQAWAALHLFSKEKELHGKEDYEFLEKCFHKLLLNFSWWVNRVDAKEDNIFEGGFLGMDNIGFTDRSAKLPPGFLLDQADGSGWVALFCLNLMRMSLFLSKKNPVYEGLGIKFFHHFIYIAASLRKGYWRGYDLWDAEEGFFHSYLHHPNGEVEKLSIRSLVGIIPLFACDVWDEKELQQFPEFFTAYRWMMEKKPHLTSTCIEGLSGTKHLFGLLHTHELQALLQKIWDPEEFRSSYGLRSVSKYHEKHPAYLHDVEFRYEPGEALEKIKGGNSNWRGPIWFPMNYLLIDSLKTLSTAFQDTISIRVGQESPVTLEEMARGFSARLLALFCKDAKGNRPCFGDAEKFSKDPHFSSYLMFHEHFHGDTGRGLGASHQTGWTALIANLIGDLR